MLHNKHRFAGVSYRWWPAKPLKKLPHPQPLSRGERGVFRQSLSPERTLETHAQGQSLGGFSRGPYNRNQQLANDVLFWKPARRFKSQWAPARIGVLLVRLVGWRAAAGTWLC